jgi:hypothetical protein
MRIFVEAAERFVSEVGGGGSIRRYTGGRLSIEYDALLIAPDVDTPYKVIPVENGTISIADALRILDGSLTV